MVSVCSNAQNTRITYPIGDFKIDPINKIVYSEEMTGGSTVNEDGSTTHWDGTVERRDPRINYETTSLIIFGNFVTFKEYFPSKCSYHSKVLQVDLGSQDLLCVKNGSRLYTFFDGKGLHVINIKGYKHITDCVFRGKDGKIYFLMSISDRELTELTQIDKLDLPTLQHVTKSYYIDKNGLYFFGCETSSRTGDKVTRWNHSGKLEDSGGKNIIPVVGDGYLVYGSAVYSTKDKYIVSKLELEGSLLNEFSFERYGDGENHYITDGTNIYRKWGNSWSWEKTTVNDIFQSGNIDNHPGQWRYVIDIVVPFNNDNKTVYYLPGPGRNLESGRSIALYNSGDSFFADYSKFDRDKPIAVKMDSVFIYNYDTRQYELLDITQYRHLTQKTYIYKNRLYDSGILVASDIELYSLEYIKSNFHQTYFLYNGKTLIHKNMLTNFREDKDHPGYLKFREPPMQNIDNKTLKIINKDMLVDENNIYYATHSEFVVIPMRELGLEVIVNTK